MLTVKPSYRVFMFWISLKAFRVVPIVLYEGVNRLYWTNLGIHWSARRESNFQDLLHWGQWPASCIHTVSCVVTDLAPQVLCLLTRIHPDTWLCYWSVELSRKASCSEPGVFKLEALPQEKETTGPMGQCLDATFSSNSGSPWSRGS